MSELFLEDNVISSLTGAFTGSIEIGWGTQGFRPHVGPQPTTPMMMANAVEALAADLRDMTVPLEASKEEIVTDAELHFQEERAPDGTPWADWAESYAPIAERENIGKLRRRDSLQLYDAATNRANYHVVGSDMFIDTGNFPVYWAIQQYGGKINTGAMSVRRYVKARRAEREGTKGKPHGEIPARPYLGLSAEAQGAIGALFDAWLGGEVVRFIPNYLRGGGLQPLVRLPSGRVQFGKMRFRR